MWGREACERAVLGFTAAFFQPGLVWGCQGAAHSMLTHNTSSRVAAQGCGGAGGRHRVWQGQAGAGGQVGGGWGRTLSSAARRALPLLLPLPRVRAWGLAWCLFYSAIPCSRFGIFDPGGMGCRVRFLVSGGAPLAPHVEDFCNVCMAPTLQVRSCLSSQQRMRGMYCCSSNPPQATAAAAAETHLCHRCRIAAPLHRATA